MTTTNQPDSPTSGPQPAHETIVLDGGILTCTTCGTTAPALQAATPAPGACDQTEKCQLRLCCRADAHAIGCTTYDPSRYPDEDTQQAAPATWTQDMLDEVDRAAEQMAQKIGTPRMLGDSSPTAAVQQAAPAAPASEQMPNSAEFDGIKTAANTASASGERHGWESAAKALTERAAGHFRNKDYTLQDECLQCASMLHDMKPRGGQ